MRCRVSPWPAAPSCPALMGTQSGARLMRGLPLFTASMACRDQDSGEVVAMSTARAIYRHADLRRLFDPRSVAIIGASPRAGSFGERTLNAMAHFDGRVHLVNARY